MQARKQTEVEAPFPARAVRTCSRRMDSLTTVRWSAARSPDSGTRLKWACGGGRARGRERAKCWAAGRPTEANSRCAGEPTLGQVTTPTSPGHHLEHFLPQRQNKPSKPHLQQRVGLGVWVCVLGLIHRHGRVRQQPLDRQLLARPHGQRVKL